MHVPVLIVGGGPVGLALCGDLATRGVASMLIERRDRPHEQPRMELVGVRTMEFCRRWGLVEEVQQAGYPRDYQQDYVYVTSVTGWELAREPFPHLDGERLPPQSPQKRERCPQDLFDPLLARWADDFAITTLAFGAELVDLVEQPDHVAVTVRDAATGHTRELTADYVVGCDGANSSVRELTGIPTSSDRALTHTTNVLLRCPDFHALHDKGEAYRFVCIGPEGPYATIVAINGADRWRLSIIGDRREHRHTHEEIDATLTRAVGRELSYEILAVLHWVRREAVAQRYATERVFLAGDAAHVMSPTGAYGMNTGLQDAVDLSWKLAATLRGWGGPGLLASYDAERRPVGARNAREASDNLRRMLTPRREPPPAEMFEPGEAGDAARARFGTWYRELMHREWFGIGIHLGYRYEDSPICWGEATPPPEDTVTTYHQTSRPGGRAPHVWIGADRSTLDLFGDAFTLLRLGSSPPPADAIVEAARRQGVPLDVHALADPEVVNAYEGYPLVLVRPDGHVAWRGTTPPQDGDGLVARVRGAGVPTGRADPAPASAA